ncbi:class A beta-lactamase [Streptomyces sp. NPDC059740]|uniref:class A beta-lactamase n=1 Tax=Streptomyces sp. NPDC059740 TaxID=3346926 RepID=UPI0036519115
MNATPSRRAALATLAGLAALPLAGCGKDTTDAASPASSHAHQTPSPSASDTKATAQAFTALERKYDARLGVYALDTGSGRSIAHRADERFAYCSTCKALLVGALLQKRSLKQLDRRVHYRRDAGAGYSPITARHLADGMTLRELCDAAVRYSDNSAANLLFREIGGPRSLQTALAGIGDHVTRSDHYEDDLSDGVPGDPRDTSTPRAMATDLRTFVLGDVLPTDKRDLLTDLLKRNTTGDALIRAGVPDDWEVGDKTGNGGYGTRNDIAILWPPKASPISLAVMSHRDTKNAEHDDKLIAEAAKVVAGALG